MKLTEQIHGCQVTCTAQRTLYLSFQPGDSCCPRRCWNITPEVGRSKIYQVFRHETNESSLSFSKASKGSLKTLKPTPLTQGQGFAMYCTWLQTREKSTTNCITLMQLSHLEDTVTTVSTRGKRQLPSSSKHLSHSKGNAFHTVSLFCASSNHFQCRESCCTPMMDTGPS